MAHEDKVNTSSIVWILGSSTVAMLLITILLAALFFKMVDWEEKRKGEGRNDDIASYNAEQESLLGKQAYRWTDEKKTKVAIPMELALERAATELVKPLPAGAKKTVPPAAVPGAPAAGAPAAGTPAATPPASTNPDPAKTPAKQ